MLSQDQKDILNISRTEIQQQKTEILTAIDIDRNSVRILSERIVNNSALVTELNNKLLKLQSIIDIK